MLPIDVNMLQSYLSLASPRRGRLLSFKRCTVILQYRLRVGREEEYSFVLNRRYVRSLALREHETMYTRTPLSSFERF